MYTSELSEVGYSTWRKGLDETVTQIRSRLVHYQGHIDHHRDGFDFLTKAEFSHLRTVVQSHLNKLLHRISVAKCRHTMRALNTTHARCSSCDVSWAIAHLPVRPPRITRAGNVTFTNL